MIQWTLCYYIGFPFKSDRSAAALGAHKSTSWNACSLISFFMSLTTVSPASHRLLTYSFARREKYNMSSFPSRYSCKQSVMQDKSSSEKHFWEAAQKRERSLGTGEPFAFMVEMNKSLVRSEHTGHNSPRVEKLNPWCLHLSGTAPSLACKYTSQRLACGSPSLECWDLKTFRW